MLCLRRSRDRVSVVQHGNARARRRRDVGAAPARLAARAPVTRGLRGGPAADRFRIRFAVIF